jgi:hypothetical protein
MAETLGTPRASDLADVELSRANDQTSIQSIHALCDPDVVFLKPWFWKLILVFCTIAVISPSKTDHKEDIYFIPSPHSIDHFLVFDLTVAELFRFVSLDISALRDRSVSSLTIPFTLIVDSTRQRQFSTLNHSRETLRGFLRFPENESRSLPFFAFSLRFSDVDLIELRFNVTSDFSQLSAFAMQASTGSKSAALFADAGRLLFALLAVAIAICFYRRSFPSLWPLFFFTVLVALPFAGRISNWVSLGLVIGVRLCFLWQPGNGRNDLASPTLALLLWALAHSGQTESAVWRLAAGFLALVNLWFAVRLNSALAYFNLALAVVSALDSAICRPLEWSSAGFIVESAHCVAAVLLMFLLRPATGEFWFQAMTSGTSVDPNGTTIVDSADE